MHYIVYYIILYVALDQAVERTSRAGYTIVSTAYVAEVDKQAMIFLFPFQGVFFISN